MTLFGRRLPDMIIKSGTLRMACIYAFRHLLSLQGHRVHNQRNMIGCLLFPLLPVVLLSEMCSTAWSLWLSVIYDVVLFLPQPSVGVTIYPEQWGCKTE